MTDTIYPAEYNPQYMDPPPPCTCNAWPRVVIRGSYCARHINSSNGNGTVAGGTRRWHDDPEDEGEMVTPSPDEYVTEPEAVGRIDYGTYTNVPDQTCTLDEWKANHGR